MALTKSVSRALQRQIDLTTAVCQERLLSTHLRHVLAFVELVADRIPFDDALDIYVRIMRLNAEQARNVGSRALAELGRRTGVHHDAHLRLPALGDEPGVEDEASEPAPDAGRSDAMFGRLRRRIRGRVHDDLRYRINLAAARAEDALLETHVENGLIFVKALADELQAPDAVELYVETMLLPEGYGDVVYNRSLRLLADEVIPPIRDEGAARHGAAAAGAPVVEPRPVSP